MTKYYYVIPCKNEVGSYIQEGEITYFPRGVFLAYSRCCLTTGFPTEEEAINWNKTYTCDIRKI